MPPLSSLVFVVILAVWAVYLVQHWVRRRDHLATARSVDRFSEAMRVLERRRSLPVPETDAHPRSYAASPLRPARPGPPQVVVKQRHGGAHGATAVAPPAAYRRSRRAARLRAGGLLLGSLTMVTLVVLAMAGVWPRWTALVGVATCALTFALVRWSVARGRAATVRRRTTPVARPASTPPAVRPADLPHHTVAARTRTHDGRTFAAQSVAVTVRTGPRREAVRADSPLEPATPELYDVHAVEAALVPDVVPADEQIQVTAPARPDDGTWDPVPVPPPTYTLKAKAYRAAPPTGSTSLPADGTEMALEEEFEDLPRVDRVG